MKDWALFLQPHTHEDFASLLALYEAHSCTPCGDASSTALIRPFRIKRYVYGEWQDTLEIQECMTDFFQILQMEPSISMLQYQELDQILYLGEAPTRWTRSSHFPSPGVTSPSPGFPTCCGPWHNGEGHFVILFMCADYWTILDPLTDYMPTPTRM
jgi:hypothetical protein